MARALTTAKYPGAAAPDVQYGALLSDAVSSAGRLAALAAVPLVASLARWRDVLALSTRPGSHLGVKLGLPHPLADLWTFVDAPALERRELYVDAPVVTGQGLSADVLIAALAFAVGTGLLIAGYVGSIDQFARQGRYDFLENVRRYGARMVAFQAVVYAVLLAIVGAALVHPVFLVVGLLVGLLAWVLFYLAPFLVVVEGRSLGDAFGRSFELVTSRREPLVFLALYAALVLLGSLPVSLLANADLPGVLVAALVASGGGLVLTVLAVLFVRDLVAPTRPTVRSASGTDVAADGD